MKFNLTLNGIPLKSAHVNGVTYWYHEGKPAQLGEPVLYFAEGIYDDISRDYIGRGWRVSQKASRMQTLATNHFLIYAQSEPVLPNLLTITQ